MVIALSASSRYATSASVAVTLPEGRQVAARARRIIPPAADHATVGWHRVTAHERLDGIAAQVIGDPELWWRLADANPTLDPDTLTATPGTRLRLTLPAGLPVYGD